MEQRGRGRERERERERERDRISSSSSVVSTYCAASVVLFVGWHVHAIAADENVGICQRAAEKVFLGVSHPDDVGIGHDRSDAAL